MNDNSKYFEILNTITPSDTETMLREWGYNFGGEYVEMVYAASLDTKYLVYDFATGTGRMVSVLTRMGYDVITGDITDVQRPDAVSRIRNEYLHKVKFIDINLEKLPFEENSIENIVCINTLHHLEKPEKSISELIRTTSKTGTLLIADFNTLGFDVMDKVHLKKNNELHARGIATREMTEKLLSEKFSSVMHWDTDLNWGLIAKSKK
ncbi:MAG: class I SAM-dependent methyltransferase [Ignavibacteriaceae bacterium]|nr:class I SAM-dependent methyltransferase [Ignavibacteriaceae bacterium]